MLLTCDVSIVAGCCDVVIKSAIFKAVPPISINKFPPSASISTTSLQHSPKVRNLALRRRIAFNVKYQASASKSSSSSLIVRCLLHRLDCRSSGRVAEPTVPPGLPNTCTDMALSEKDIRIDAVETLVRYRFHNPALLWEALQGPTVLVDSVGKPVPPDGNKRLAIVGDAAIRLALAKNWYPGKTSKGKI